MSSNTTHRSKNSIKTLKAYLVGLVLALLLTFVSFALAWMHLGRADAAHLLSGSGLMFMLMFLAVVQLFVQATCFLRLNGSKDGRWELMPFLFVIFVVIIFVAGSMWIMWNLNYNMMN